jgi:acyl dehydratase
VYSFVEIHHPQYPIFDYPLIAVLVELEEGTRILSNLVGIDADEVEVGMPVELVIQATDPELNLPLFRRARPPRRETTLNFEDVKIGDALPPCPVAITPTLIVGGAMASRDFQDVHHDVELAKKRGSPDIFMNIMTSGGLTSRFVTDWAGPEVILRNMKIRLGAPNYPGDLMTFTGLVNSSEMRDGKGIIEVGVRGANRFGDHVSGTLELELPRR